MKSNKRTRAVGYIRVSDESQVEGHSLDAQRKEIGRWSKQRGLDLIAIYAEEGRSAHTEKIHRRPQLARLLKDAEAGAFDIVVVHNIDRWSRNVGVQRQALQRLGDANVGFASVAEDIDFTTPAGRLLLTMMGGVAEFFSDQLGFHVSKAQKHRAELGLPVGPTPFGYDVPEPGGAPKVNEAEAKAVQEVFQQRVLRESTGAIANWLNAQGFRTRKGNIFTGHAVKDILGNRFYLGKVQYQGNQYEGQHDPIISEDLYHGVLLLKQRRKTTRSVTGSKGLLQGRIFCGNCGSSIQADRHRYGAPMYRERHSTECETNNKSIMAKVVDEQIGSILQAVQLKANWRGRMAKLAASDIEGPNPQELMQKRRRLSRAYADGAFTDAEYQQRLIEIDSDMRNITSTEMPSIEEAAALFEDIPTLWSEATQEERRKLLSPLVERVYVDIDSRLVGAVTPMPAFANLMENAMSRAESSAVLLLSEDETRRAKVWSWWRRGRVELHLTRKIEVLLAA